MQLCVLGPLEVTVGGKPLPVPGILLRRLLVRLAVDAPVPVGQADLVTALWPLDKPGDSANALQSLVSRLRRVLGGSALVQQVPGGYRLQIDRSAVDVHRAEELASAGHRSLQQGDPVTALRDIAEGLALFRGQPLFDAGDAEYAQPLGVKLADLRLELLEQYFASHLRLGRPEEVLAELERTAAADLLRERFTQQLMTALVAAGRTAEALAAYERLRSFLAGELGVDPSAELQALHLALLRGELPALGRVGSSPQPVKSNLRSYITSFLGRQTELDRLTRLLGEHRLTTIVGPGGAGKTRLAAQAATSWSSRLRDGVWMVELAPVTEDAGIQTAVLEALGSRAIKILERIADRDIADSDDRLFDLLERSDCLLIFDNCEHLLVPVADLADRILARCPQVQVLATSREPLGIVGEALCAIPPLGLPPAGAGVAEALQYPAVQLLVDRAAASTEFEVNDETVGPTVEIVRRLDGLPLAIELAAARLRLLPIGQIAARLSDRFRLLSGGMRAAVPRHRTLRAVVEWSWDLLSAPERLLAERLAVFPAGATPESAAAVCAGSEVPVDDVPELLLSLADKSLLQVTGGAQVRYRMLETIREYGIERLVDRGEVDRTRFAHASYFARRAEFLDPVLRTGDQLSALDELNAERENILAGLRYLGDSGDVDRAVEMALALSWYWTLVGAHGDAITWLDYTLKATEGSEHPDRIFLEAMHASTSIFGAGDATDLAGITADPAVAPGAANDLNAAGAQRWERWRSKLRLISLQLEDRPVDRAGHLDLVLRPMLAFFAGDTERGEFLVQAALQSDDPWVRAATMVMRGNFAENEGDIEKMRKSVDVALEEFTRIGDRWGLSGALNSRAVLRTFAGELPGAIEDLEQALGYAEEIGAFDDNLIIHLRLADLKMRLGDTGAARRHLELATEVNAARPVASDREVMAQAALASLAQLDGDRAAAIRMIADLRKRLGITGNSARTHGHLVALVGSLCATIAVDNGLLDDAYSDLRAAYPQAVGTMDLPVLAGVGVAVAVYSAARGQTRRAAEILGAAAQLRGGVDPTEIRIARLTAALREEFGAKFDQLFERGRRLDRADAIALLNPVVADLFEGATVPPHR